MNNTISASNVGVSAAIMGQTRAGAPPAAQEGSSEPSATKAPVQINEKVLIDPADLSAALESLNQRLEKTKSNLSFSIDPQTGSNIVRVVNSNTGELVRQLPSEEVLQFKRNLDSMMGLIFDKKT
jgi:flagellar protein FlaG